EKILRDPGSQEPVCDLLPPRDSEALRDPHEAHERHAGTACERGKISLMSKGPPAKAANGGIPPTGVDAQTMHRQRRSRTGTTRPHFALPSSRSASSPSSIKVVSSMRRKRPRASSSANR